MITQERAERFAAEWVDAWNSHDLAQVLPHYTDNFTMSSPYIVQIAGEPSGILHGKAAVADYWAKALALVPDLRFELLTVFVGAHSITIHYRNQAGRLVAEVLRFDTDSLVVEGIAHYSAP